MEEDPLVTTESTWTWVDILVVSLGALAVFVAGIVGLRFLIQPADLQTENTIYLSIGLAVLETLALVGSVYWLGLRRKGLSWQNIGFHSISTRWVVLAGLIGLGVIPLAGLIALLIRLALGLPAESPQLEFLAPGEVNLPAALGMILLGGILAPFAEEVFFRGMIYQWIRDRWGLWAGIVLSGLIFGLVHVEPSVAAAAAILGMILAWVFEKSGSIWSAVLIHAINNTIQIALLYLVLSTNIPVVG